MRITIAVCLVLVTTIWNLTRVFTGIAWRGLLETYAPRPGFLYISVSGAIWAAVGLAVLWSLWRRLAWAPRALLLAAILYAAWVWADRLLLQVQGRQNWPFSLAVTLVLLGFTVAVATDARNRAYFGRETHDRKFKNRPLA